MKQAKRIIVMTLTIMTLLFCFVSSVNAANITVGLLKEVKATQTSNSVTLSWNKAENAKGYRVYKMVDGKWKAIKTTTSRTYTVTGLKGKTRYTFAVKPYTKIDGETVWAKKYVKVDTCTTGYVANLAEVSAVRGANSIELSWEKAVGAEGYRIYQKVNGNWKALKTTTALKYNVTNLKERTDYTFAVRPYTKVDGETVWAKKYTQIDTCTTAFVGNIEKVTVTQSGDSITLSWSKAQGAKGYRVYEMINGSWKALKTTTALKYTINDLDFGSTHTYAIKPYTKADGETIWAKKYTAITVDIENPQDDLIRDWFITQFEVAVEQYISNIDILILNKNEEIKDLTELASSCYVEYQSEIKRIKNKCASMGMSNSGYESRLLKDAELNYQSNVRIYSNQIDQLREEICDLETELSDPNLDNILSLLAEECNITFEEASEYFYLYID